MLGSVLSSRLVRKYDERPLSAVREIQRANLKLAAYNKNLRLQMGRCPVRSIFAEALELLMQTQHLLGFLTEHVIPLSHAVEGYTVFERREVVKVILDADN